MKAKIIIGLSLLLIMSGWFGYRQLSEAKRYKQNWIAEKQHRDQERVVTQRELSTVYNITEGLQRQLNIKPKQVERWMRAPVQYRDTGTTKTITIPADTILIYPDSITGVLRMPCYDLSILLYRGQFSVEQAGNDTISVILYRTRPKKFLFIKYGAWIHRAALYSSCRDSVYQVTENVRVMR